MIRPILLVATILMITSCGLQKVNNRNASSLMVDFEKPKGVSFKVNDVEMADSLLIVNQAQQIFENKIGKEILFFPEEQANIGLVNCPNNGLIQTVQECYDNHRPLVLTPDIIWLAICQGVSIHINENYDSLKNILFISDKPDKIVIRNDSLEYSPKHWKNLIASFSSETKKYTNDDFYSFYVSEFSTTTSIDQTAYQITLLESYKKAFAYIGESGCGIPTILIAGNRQDWETILKKLDMLDKIGLSSWAKNLKPIITEFIQASLGKQKKEFWQNIYKNASEYNAFYISGWIIKFFPYIKVLEPGGVYDAKLDASKVGEYYKPNPFYEGDNYLQSTLSTDNFPSGVAKISVTWNNLIKGFTKEIEVYAGFFAMKQYSDKSLEPLISWAICEANAKKAGHILAKNIDRNLKHHPEYWSPNFASNIQDSAVYDIKTFKSQRLSLNYIRQILLDSLKNKPAFQDYLRDTLQIEVLSNGKIGNVYLMRLKTNVLLMAYLKGVLQGLPKEWFPALVHPEDVFGLMDFSEKEKKMKIRANSEVKIGL